MKRFVVRTIVGLMLLGVIVTAVVAWTAGETPGDRAVVTSIIDGDTLVADLGNRTETIRLLNVDTPETKDPAKPVECLGPEASAFLASMVPVGSAITLQYDDERLDRYGRTLAGVLTSKGVLVNAEIARAGLGTAVMVDGNHRFLPAVQAAQQEAADNGRGLYSRTVACTLPVTVAAVVEAVADVASPARPPSGTARQIDDATERIARICDETKVLVEAFGGDRSGPLFAVLTREEQDALAQQVLAADTVARRTESELRLVAAAAGNARTRAGSASRPDSPAATAETAAPTPGPAAGPVRGG